MEYRFFNNNPNQFRNVQRLDFFTPSVTGLDLNIFASEESFFLPADGQFEMTRFYAGLKAFDSKRLSFNFIMLTN